MPSINHRKIYRPNAWYHIYNRGNNRENIFFRDFDYIVFRNILQDRLSQNDITVSLKAFALLPNHYHLLIHQKNTTDVIRLMSSVGIRYALYCNKSYNRVGRLFQGSYKAALIPPTLRKKTRSYILNNPIEAGLNNWKHVGTSI